MGFVALRRRLEDLGFRIRSVVPLAGDVSRRRPFRVTLRSGITVIAVEYPESLREMCRRFVATTEILAAAGIPIPAVLASDCSGGLCVVEDAGTEALHELDDPDAMRGLLERAVDIAGLFADLPRERIASLNPPLDAEALRGELDRTVRALLVPRGLVPSPVLEDLGGAFDELCRQLDDGDLVSCHRDFMARNLMIRGDELVVIDHQDLRPGPRSYDLASLLNDTIFVASDLEARLLLRATGSAEPSPGYRRATVQRCLKAAGTFADTGHHPELIQPSLARAWSHWTSVPELAPLAPALASTLGSFGRPGV